MMVTNRASLQPQAAVRVRTADRRERRRRVKLSAPVWLGLVALIVLGMALLYVGQKTYIMTLTYRVEAAERRLAEATREQEFLQLQMAAAHSLDRVEQVAIGRLGMVHPTARQFVVVENAGPAAPVAEVQAAESRGLISIAVDWVARHWPRLDTAEAGGDRR